MNESEVLVRANEIANPHGLTASYLGPVRSVGVGGDQRTETKVVNLEGLFPGYEILADISTRISNETGINRVTYQLAP